MYIFSTLRAKFKITDDVGFILRNLVCMIRKGTHRTQVTFVSYRFGITAFRKEVKNHVSVVVNVVDEI